MNYVRDKWKIVKIYYIRTYDRIIVLLSHYLLNDFGQNVAKCYWVSMMIKTLCVTLSFVEARLTYVHFSIRMVTSNATRLSTLPDFRLIENYIGVGFIDTRKIYQIRSLCFHCGEEMDDVFNGRKMYHWMLIKVQNEYYDKSYLIYLIQ